MLLGVLVVGILLTALGWVFARERTCASVLVGAFYLLGVGLAGLLFVAFSYVTRAAWSVAIRKVPEAMASTLPVGALAIIVALLGVPWLYQWTHAGHDHVLAQKAVWLDTGFFLMRAGAYLGIWLLYGARLKRIPASDPRRRTRWSAFFLVVFSITFSLACFDWIMSLEAHWFSTVFAAYNLAGLFLAGLAVLTLALVALRRTGALRNVVRDDHLHDIGKLTLAFATFWGYLWFCQYMLIWYGNLPEETSYFVRRMEGAWGVLQVTNPVVNWLIPFLVLLPRSAKRNERVMLWVAVLLLVGRWLDLYMMVLPPFLPESPRLGLWELAPVAAALAIGGLALFRAAIRAEPVPKGDPLLSQSLRHHT